MIIETAAAIAEVLGFSITAYDRFVTKHGGSDVSRHFALLAQLAPLTDAWKHIHKEYHTIMPDYNNLIASITVYEGRNEDTMALHRVNRAHVNSVLTGGALGIALTDFSDRLINQVNTIKKSTKSGDKINECLEAILQHTPSISDDINQLRTSGIRTSNEHQQFCLFFSTVDEYLNNNQHSDDLYKYILDKRRSIQVYMRNVVLDCDRAIISSLGIFKQVIDEVK